MGIIYTFLLIGGLLLLCCAWEDHRSSMPVNVAAERAKDWAAIIIALALVGAGMAIVI